MLRPASPSNCGCGRTKIFQFVKFVKISAGITYQINPQSLGYNSSCFSFIHHGVGDSLLMRSQYYCEGEMKFRPGLTNVVKTKRGLLLLWSPVPFAWFFLGPSIILLAAIYHRMIRVSEAQKIIAICDSKK